MTYARSRLLVGITAVGTWVVICIAFLAAGGASLLSDAEASAGMQAGLLFAVLGVYVLVSLPFDLLGGLVLPRRHGRAVAPTGAYLAGLLRGVVVQVVVMAVAAALIVLAGSAGGDGAGLAVAAGIALVIALGRLPLARAVAALGQPVAMDDAAGTVTIAAADVGFTGGVTGLSGRIAIPAAWRDALGDGLQVELARRRSQAGASYWLGIVVALAWTVGGVALSMALPGGGAGDMSALVATGAWFTLWSFVGLLVLPSVSRPAVHAADAAAAAAFPHEQVAAVISSLDALQDDEPKRPDAVEAIFHPIPGAAGRIAALSAPPPGPRPWNVARTALPMSWCCLGLLGRAVHCNAGRPELWVLLPTD